MKTVIKYSIYATAFAFVAIYALRAMDDFGVKPEAVETFEQENPKLIKATEVYVEAVEKKVKNFEWESFKIQVQEALGIIEKQVDKVESTAVYAAEYAEETSEGLEDLQKDLEEADKSVEEFESKLDQAMESQVDYQETIDELELRIQEVLSLNKDKDKKRLRLVNGKKIARLEKKLFRTKDPVRKEKLRDLIKALSGEF